jgi:hypothetical protein
MPVKLSSGGSALEFKLQLARERWRLAGEKL